MKIIHYIAESGWGGGPQHVLWLCAELSREGKEVEVWSSSAHLVERAKEQNLPAKIIPHTRTKAVLELRKVLKRENPAILHLHGVRAALLGGWAAKNLPHTICYTEHHLTRDVPMSIFRKKLQVKLLRGILAEASAVIAPSRACAEFLIKQRVCPEAKVHLIPHGLPKITNPLPQKLKLSEPIVGAIGSLLPVKNFGLLIRSLKDMPEVSLAIAGSGPDKLHLLGLVEKLNLKEKVQFTGRLEDPYPFLAALSVYLQPSSSESFGLSVLQAMQVGVVPIVSARGALPEIVENGKDGLVLQSFSPHVWAKAVVDLLADAKLRKNMAKSCSKKANKDYTLEKMAKATQEVYAKFFEWR